MKPTRTLLATALCGLTLFGLGLAATQKAQAGASLNALFRSAPANSCPDVRATSRPASFESPAVNPIVYDPARNQIYAADIANSQIAVIDPVSQAVIRNIPVGLGPAALALAPVPGDPTGATRLYVANSLSDSVSVINLDLPLVDGTRGAVIQTLTATDPDGRSMLDTPTGLVTSADGQIGYVALSHLNRIAVVDLQTLAISSTVYSVPALDPRAIRLSADGRTLYVASFSPGNRTRKHYMGTLDGQAFDDNNLTWDQLIDVVGDMEFGLDVDNSMIEVDPTAPDNDLIAVNLTTGATQTVGDIGSILYDLAVQGNNITVAGTEARNTANNFPDDLAGRPIRNLVVSLNCDGSTCTAPVQHDLDLIDGQPDRSTPAAIPSAIVTAPDGANWVTALGSNVLLQVDASGSVINRYPVGAMPMAVTLNPDASTAYVLNRGDNTVSVVDLATGSTSLVSLQPDATPDTIADGRRVFYDASHARNASFACASCHPNGNTDGLIWSLVDGKHTTQSIHHIAGTAPYHWFGTLPDAITLVEGNYHGDMFQYRPTDAEEIGVPTDCQMAHEAEYIESVDMQVGPTRPLSDRMSALARDGAAVVRRGQFILDNNISSNAPDPAIVSRLAQWARPWVNIPRGSRFTPLTLFGNCASCHANALETSDRTDPVAGNPPSLAGGWERWTMTDSARSTNMNMRSALNTLIDRINLEITRRNQFLPPNRRIPLLDDHYRILTNSMTTDNARLSFHEIAHRSNQTPFTAANWAVHADKAALLNPFFLFDRYVAYVDEQSTGFSATLGQQVTATTDWITTTQGARLVILTAAAQQEKISLWADGVILDDAGNWSPLHAQYQLDTGLFVDATGQTWTSGDLINRGLARTAYATFTGQPAGNVDVTRGAPLIDNVVRADVTPNADGARPMATVRARDGQIELLIRGSGFATGDMVLGDGTQILGTLGQVDTLPSGQLEGHFFLNVSPVAANDYYVLTVHTFATAGGRVSNEFAIPVTP